MKRIIIVLFVLASLTGVSQESVLLRVNYQKGDMYVVKMEQKQDMGAQGGVDLTMTMNMIVEEVNEDNYKTESKIAAIVMDMAQGINFMSYDSSKKAEDLDEAGKMMKGQFDPMMKAVIYTTISKLGENVETKIEPSIPGMDQMASESGAIRYPEEKVSVGSSWTSEDEKQGMKLATTYKVAKIENGTVYLEISGTVSGLGKGTITGNAEVDIETGVQKIADVKTKISINGMEMSVSSKMITKKV
jgi:hypothetical protein